MWNNLRNGLATKIFVAGWSRTTIVFGLASALAGCVAEQPPPYAYYPIPCPTAPQAPVAPSDNPAAVSPPATTPECYAVTPTAYPVYGYPAYAYPYPAYAYPPGGAYYPGYGGEVVIGGRGRWR
jgi:hypothetical protein